MHDIIKKILIFQKKAVPLQVKKDNREKREIYD